MAEKISVPTYPQYTNLALGEGLFDQLMTTVKYHLMQEYNGQRIRGAEYSKVYLGSMEAVMANTTQYLLGTMLIDQQRAKLIAEILLLGLEAEKLRFEIDFLYPLMKMKAEVEIELINAQIEKIMKEIEFLDAKIDSEIANVDATDVLPNSVIGRQMALLEAQKLGFAGDIYTKTAKLYADYDAVFQSVQEDPDSAELSEFAVTAIGNAEEVATVIEAIP
jgi:hypothetical protein